MQPSLEAALLLPAPVALVRGRRYEPFSTWGIGPAHVKHAQKSMLVMPAA